MTGLVRSLLHDTLQGAPELIPAIFPSQWEELRSTPWQAMRKIRFLEMDIDKAFSRLISADTLPRNYCFCFFIDGLDEYEGRAIQEDFLYLAERLRAWTAKSSSRVKLCVSSREKNEFSFSPSQRIRLHEVTREDMTRYVFKMLEIVEKETCRDYRSRLTKTVVENADGVFLWVALVVKRIRQRVNDGYEMDKLMKEVDNIPREVELLFGHLLNDIDPADRTEAYQIFSLVENLAEINALGLELSLLAYSFLDDYNRDHSFPLRDNLAPSALPPADLQKQIKLTRKRLNGCCKGLVETRPWHGHDVIRFTHRSVPEFLADCFQDVFPAFDKRELIRTISHLALAELFADPELPLHQRPYNEIEWLNFLFLRHESKLDHESYEFLDFYWLAMKTYRRLLAERNGGTKTSPTFPEGTALFLPCHIDSLRRVAVCLDVNLLRAVNASRPAHPIYTAAFLGNYGYVRQKLSDPAAASQFSLQLLLYCMLELPTPQSSIVTDFPDTFDMLMSAGLTPHARTSFWMLAIPKTEQPELNEGMTTWHRLLLGFFFLHEQGKPRPDCEYILIKFLESGVDPYFQLRTRTELEDVPQAINLVLGRERRNVLLVFSDRVAKLGDDKLGLDLASLTEFVKWFGFENEKYILHLIKKNMEWFEGVPQEEAASMSLKQPPILENLPPDQPSESSTDSAAKSADQDSKDAPLLATTTTEKQKLSGSFAGLRIENAGIHVSMLVFGENSGPPAHEVFDMERKC